MGLLVLLLMLVMAVDVGDDVLIVRVVVVAVVDVVVVVRVVVRTLVSLRHEARSSGPRCCFLRTGMCLSRWIQDDEPG